MKDKGLVSEAFHGCCHNIFGCGGKICSWPFQQMVKLRQECDNVVGRPSTFQSIWTW